MPGLYFFYFSFKNHSFYKSESISPKKGRLPMFSLDKRPVFFILSLSVFVILHASVLPLPGRTHSSSGFG